MRRRHWLFLIALSVALSVSVPVVYGGFASVAGLTRLPWWGFCLLLGMVLLGWSVNGARVQLLTHSLGGRLRYVDAVLAVVAAEFAGATTPAGAGEPATYVFLLTRSGLRAGQGAAVVAVDKFTDLVFFATAIPIALLFYLNGEDISHPSRMMGLGVSLVAAGFILLAMVLRYYRRIAIALGHVLRRIPRLRHSGFRLARALIQFRHSVRFLLTMNRVRLLALYSLCLTHWLLRYSVLPVLLWVLGESVPWGYLFVAQGILLFVGQATFLPGGGGGVEVGFGALLLPYLNATDTATALLLWRFFTFYWYLIAGAPVFTYAGGARARMFLDRDRARPKVV